MSGNHEGRLHHKLDRMEAGLPGFAARAVAWLRQPKARVVRVPVAFLFMAGGVAGFLPILGFWMLPIGLLLLAIDFPPLQAPVVRLLEWGEKLWHRLRGRARSSN